jgi:hypothetical protein
MLLNIGNKTKGDREYSIGSTRRQNPPFLKKDLVD